MYICSSKKLKSIEYLEFYLKNHFYHGDTRQNKIYWRRTLLFIVRQSLFILYSNLFFIKFTLILIYI